MRSTSVKGITVFEVIYHNDATPYAGAAGDGSFIERFRKEADAARFAASRTYYGKPCTVLQTHNVPRKLAQRWGLC